MNATARPPSRTAGQLLPGFGYGFGGGAVVLPGSGARAARLAREMHDVLSHQVSLIAVQGGSPQVGADGDDTRRHTPGRLADLVSDIGLDERLPGSGDGLVGLWERTENLGGTLVSGPTPEGGYQVDAVLPHRRT
ncbi:histidine kinase [Streptomyces sp. NBC_00158]|uniref:histidine kinase n=1 Tax=Streptomyces sp. NBC_00158 TaxID=2903627 RepID=UPI002F90D7D2